MIRIPELVEKFHDEKKGTLVTKVEKEALSGAIDAHEANAPIHVSESERAKWNNASGENDYNLLNNRPAIEGATLEGDQSAADLGLATETTLNEEVEARIQGDAATLEAAKEYSDAKAVAHDISLEGSGTEFDPLSAGYYEPLTSTPTPDYDLRGVVSGHNPNSSWNCAAWSVTYASRSETVVYARQSLSDGGVITVDYEGQVVTLFDGNDWVYEHKFFDPEYVFGLREPFYFQGIAGDPWEDTSIIDYKVRKLEDAYHQLVDSGETASNPSTGDLAATLTLFLKGGNSIDIDFTNIIANLVNKASGNANGTTVFDNADGDDGLAISDTQPATETIAAFETNHEAGNPVRIGHYLKHISNPTDNYRLVGMIDANSAKKLYLLKNKAAAPSDPEQIDPNDEVLNKGEITTAIFGALASIGGALPVPSAIELESELPDISEGAETTLYYLIENMDVSYPDAVRQGQAWAAPGAVEWTKFIDIVNQLSLDAFKQREDGSWVLADDIQTLIDGAVQGSQIKTAEPTASSTDAQVTSAKRLWTMLGAALSTLTTTAKTIVGAINELAAAEADNAAAIADEAQAREAGDDSTLSDSKAYTDEKIAAFETNGRDMGGWWFGKTTADFEAPMPESAAQNCFDFTTNTPYTAKEDLSGWDAGTPLELQDGDYVNITSHFWDLAEGQLSGKAIYSELEGWAYFPNYSMALDGDTLVNRESDGAAMVAAQDFAITEATDKFTSGASLSFKAFWQGVLNKINGLIQAVAGKQSALNRTVRTNLASTTAITDTGGNITPGVTGTLPIANGGTGATTAAAALTNLGAVPVVKRYQHNIVIHGLFSSYNSELVATATNISFSYRNNISTAATSVAALKAALVAAGIESGSSSAIPEKLYPASGQCFIYDKMYPVVGLFYPTTSFIIAAVYRPASSGVTPTLGVFYYGTAVDSYTTDVVVDLCA